MIDIFEEYLIKGEAKGEAKGVIASIRHRLTKGRLTLDEARAEIQELIADGEIPSAVGQQALAQLAGG